MAQQGERPVPKYQQIAADLRARIEAGEYPVGSRLQTKDELMVAYGVALATVDSALGVLRSLGMVETRQGSGTFVLSEQPEVEPSPEFVKLMERLDGLEAEIRRQAERIDELEHRPHGQ